jgi:predicted DNA-binding transcriptional regulator AlpA
VRRLLRYAELRERGIRHSRQHLQELIRLKKFPAPIKTGRNVSRFEDEVDAHIEALADARDHDCPADTV